MLAVVLAAVGALLVLALASFALGRADATARAVGACGGAAACAVGAVASGVALLRGDAGFVDIPWAWPIGAVHLGLDGLSAFFLVCIFVVSGLALVYSLGYFRERSGRALAFSNALVASMAIVALARDALSFLFAWEVMTVASYFLVVHEDEEEAVRRAGLVYLVASQAGAAAVFAAFGLLIRHAGGALDFASWRAAGAPTALVADMGFALAVIGFGAKAGIWPMHVWLPEAHPAAPSPVSALMSGVMIKMGVYGLVRMVGFLGPVPMGWGGALVVLGAVSAAAGVLHALAQHDLKRLLAYHSVENVGIIVLGIGLGLIGQAAGEPALAIAGWAGGLLHVLNHGLFKGLLFQGAGSVLHATGSRVIDRMGGLGRRMPVTAGCFLVGAVAISGLPPLNGFTSEFLVYLGAFAGLGTGRPAAAVAGLAALGSLALIGGLASACFVKVTGVVFLGSARTREAEHAHEAGPAMRGAMIAGASCCVVLGLWPPAGFALVRPAVAGVLRIDPATLALPPSLVRIAVVGAVLVAVAGLLALVRLALLRGRDVRAAPTWGCGYAHPTPRMQYTAASFVDPVLAPFDPLVPDVAHAQGPDGWFPAPSRYESHRQDLAADRLVMPAAGALVRAFGALRVLQQGRLQLYLVYVFATLVVLLAWQLAMPRGGP